MPRFALLCLSVGCVWGIATFCCAADPIDYQRDIKPLLARCTSCHGALRQQGSLRVDTASLLRQGGDSGPAVSPGKPEESLLIQAINGSDGMSQMPPEDTASRLQDDEVARLRTWIEQGAVAPDEPAPADPRAHWAFRQPVRPHLPAVQDPSWVRNPIDALVAAERERRGLTPLPPADKHVLLRRVYLDLIGLPPTREELQAFLADERPDAYEQIVRRLLDSPQYGERWGRHWMDVWRYSDWAGYGAEIRESQYHIWRWRDWIISSLNADRPYDQMVIEMLAGDELAPSDPEVLRATGFLGRNWFKFNRNVWLENTVEHTGKAFLALTFNCAKCHEHKFDPFEQVDFFHLRAFFEPHQVRTDRVPGQADVTRDGVSRVFDETLQAPTYVFARGNEAEPLKDQPIAPAVPAFLGGERLQIQPVSLPVQSFYPSLQPQVVDESLAAARANVQQAEAAVTQAAMRVEALRREAAEKALAAKGANDAAESPATAAPQLAQAELAQQATVKLRDAAQARLVALEARVAAERTKYGLQPGELPPLAASAAQAERQANLAAAEGAALDAEAQLAAVRLAEKPDDAKTAKAVTDAQTKLETARKTLESARQQAAATDTTYSSLGPIYPPSSSGRRLALARWIADRENPLTARVAVNHIWLRHFGTALVPTVFDFGLHGQPPSHPELLDWLAVELMDNGWRMKELHRLIVTSSTYRMGSSQPGHEAARRQIDPDNHFLWKMNARRLEAEAVRDSVLHVAGGLDLTQGGPEIDQNQGETSPRRSVYFRHAKEKQMLFVKLFDGPGVSECYRRDESVVPQQALALANSSLAKAQARRLAQALSRENGPAEQETTHGPFIERAFEQVLTRSPSAEEMNACLKFLQSQTILFADRTQLSPATVGEAAPVAPADSAALRARENLIHVLLNHNDFVMLR